MALTQKGVYTLKLVNMRRAPLVCFTHSFVILEQETCELTQATIIWFHYYYWNIGNQPQPEHINHYWKKLHNTVLTGVHTPYS